MLFVFSWLVIQIIYIFIQLSQRMDVFNHGTCVAVFFKNWHRWKVACSISIFSYITLHVNFISPAIRFDVKIRFTMAKSFNYRINNEFQRSSHVHIAHSKNFNNPLHTHECNRKQLSAQESENMMICIENQLLIEF